MKKATVTLALMTFSAMIVASAFARPWETYEPYAKNQGQAGKSCVYHVYMVQKDADWVIVKSGAWGKLTLNTKASRFILNGHGLMADIGYTLINYGGWNYDDIILGSATSDSDGNVHISGDFDISAALTDQDDARGLKFWLVLSEDVGASRLTGWNPLSYLFEYDVI